MNINFIDFCKSNYKLIPYNLNGNICEIICVEMKEEYKGRLRKDLWYDIMHDNLHFLDGTKVKLLEEIEIWKDIEPVLYKNKLYLADKEGNAKYECSNFYGKVRNRKTKKPASVGDAGEYLDIRDKDKKFLIHRLIFRAFIVPEKYSGIWNDELLFDTSYHIDHIDGIKINNQPSNLRAVSPSDNASNRIPKEITEQFNFRPPYKSKSPKMQWKKNQKIYLIDNHYIVLSLKDLGGILNGNNTKKYTLSKNGKVLNLFEIKQLTNKEKDDIMQYLCDIYDAMIKTKEEL